MVKACLFYVMAFSAMIASTAANPVVVETNQHDARNISLDVGLDINGEDISLPEFGDWEVEGDGDGSELEVRDYEDGEDWDGDIESWNLEEPPLDDDVSPNNGTIFRRGKKDFRFFRRRFYTKACGPEPGNCEEGSNDVITIHSSCNGGGCGVAVWRKYDSNMDVCNKEFKVCGTSYKLKYTGKEWSCAHLHHFSMKGAHHDVMYAYLMRGNRRAGTCKVDTKRWYARSCSAFGASEFWSQVHCWLY